MWKLAMAVGLVYMILGVALAVSPEWFLSAVDWDSRQGLYVSAGIRFFVGVILLLAASTSKFPKVFRVIGVMALAAGLLLPVVPIEFWGEVMRWWTMDHLTLFRAIVATGATLGGGFIAYAAAPRRETA
jgi:hypothetical protein